MASAQPLKQHDVPGQKRVPPQHQRPASPDHRHHLQSRCADRTCAPTYEAGKQAAAAVQLRFRREYPAAMASLGDDLEASLAHLQLPVAHHQHVRTTNLIERSFLEERRRTKIIPRFFDERSCLKLVYATLVRASQRWQRIRITEVEREQLLRLRQELGLRPQQIRTPRPKEGKRVKEAVAA